jgi:hypothetical protein
MATAFLPVLLVLVLGLGTGFGQNDQGAPPPEQPSGQADQPEQGMGRHMGHRPMPTVDEQLKHLTTELNLTSDQQAKLKPILEDQRAQMDKLHQDASLTRQDRFSKMQELRQGSDAQIKRLLSEDQQKNFDKMREKQGERMKQWQKRGGGGGGQPPAGGPDSQP